jgi:hypothetical protein
MGRETGMMPRLLTDQKVGVRVPPGALCVETDDKAPDLRKRQSGAFVVSKSETIDLTM